MIDAKELRIGNFIQNGQGLFAKVNAIDGGMWMHFEGIPLTPEILSKCGFILKEGMNYNIYRKAVTFPDAHGLMSPQVYSINENCTNIFMNGRWICRIDFLHQLQNLFFALTGEELEINL